ncbi:MAG TPA: glycerol-3-phosphate dehydrogenase [Terriglobia bacterium]|nr:glycerol-3-phosphate dehydrogenase [Terriglobia bacterium]
MPEAAPDGERTEPTQEMLQRNPEKLSSTTFDLVVIGGGINGASTAREAALRGMKAALVDAGDFAAATSSRSSKLIHGGLRYLEQFEFRLVREARRERRLLRELAPHLARPVPFLVPIYHGDPYSPLKIRLGLTIYDLLGNLGTSDRHQMLSKDELLRRVPSLRTDGLRAGALYHDSETDDARLTIENIIDAANHGALVANYAEIRSFKLDKRKSNRPPVVESAELEDRRTGRRYEISSRFWVNATGPWVDHVRGLLPGYDGSKTVRLTKGTHIVIPPVAGEFAMFAAILSGKRIFVMIPWHGQALLGTTDTDYDGDPARVSPDTEDVEYLLGAINRVLREPLKTSDVIGAYAGLRALAIQPGASPSENTREYRFHQDPWAANLITVCGGKLTTSRSLGEKLVDQVVTNLPGSLPASWAEHPTRKTPLPGGHTNDFEHYLKDAAADAVRLFNIPPAAAERIVRTYGTRWQQVLEPIRRDRKLADPLPGCSACLGAEVVFAIENEMALELDDFLLRRSGLNWYAAHVLREAVPRVAEIFAEKLGWDRAQIERAVSEFRGSRHFCAEASR